MAKSVIEIKHDGRQPPPSASPYGGEIICNQPDLQFKRSFNNPVVADADNENDVVICIDQNIVASATFSVDLQTILDRYAVQAAMTAITWFSLINLGTGSLVMRRPAANGWTNFLDATGSTDLPQIILPIGMPLHVGPLDDNVLEVSGSNKAIDFVEIGGSTTARLVATFWGRR